MKSAPPSSNWLALKKKLPSKKTSTNHSQKLRKLHHEPVSFPREPAKAQVEPEPVPGPSKVAPTIKNGESIPSLRKMILGEMQFTESQQLPGKFLALDCEMVGVGIDGAESSLARVSLVNFYGAIQLDEFVAQRERVVDYRTQFSGVRDTDMIKAKPFNEVQKRVAELLQDRILVGHAVYNDLKALLLPHPRPQIRDTQYYAGKFKVTTSKRVALRNLVQQELEVAIQGGEHSSVTDARATMAVYRLHRKEWEKGNRPIPPPLEKASRKRKRSQAAESDSDEEEDERKKGSNFPGGGRKGVSSGLSTITKKVKPSEGKGKWWKELVNPGL